MHICNRQTIWKKHAKKRYFYMLIMKNIYYSYIFVLYIFFIVHKNIFCLDNRLTTQNMTVYHSWTKSWYWYIRWYLWNIYDCKEQSFLFSLFKAFDYIESNNISDFFFSENPYFPLCVRNMFCDTIWYKYHRQYRLWHWACQWFLY